jgi:hypothetical protein
MQLIRERFSFIFENFFEAYSKALHARKNLSKMEEKILEGAIPNPKLALFNPDVNKIMFVMFIKVKAPFFSN